MEMVQKAESTHISISLKFVKRIVLITILLIIFFNIGNVVWSSRDKYSSSNYWQRFPGLKKAYYDSIYANKKGTWLPDEILYSFNGGALIKGKNPILVNPEVPALGKYIIGAFALVFSNEHITVLVFSAISLFVLFLIGKQIFSSSLVALIPLLFISFEPIFLNQLRYTPLLDIIHLSFLLFIFYFFNASLISKKHVLLFLILVNLFFGFFISTKFFAIGTTVIFAFIIVLILNRDIRRGKILVFSSPLSVAVLLLSYIRVLIIGYPLNKFIGIQKWIFLYNQGHIYNLFSVWPLLMFNVWHTNSKILSDPQWRITWPIITVLSLLTVLAYLFRKIPRKKEIEILMAWTVSYLVFLSFGNASARYFVILIPVMYLVAVFGVFSIYKLAKGRIS